MKGRAVQEVEQTLTLIDRYGLPIVLLVLLAVAGWYVLRRLLNRDDGILTQVGSRHIKYLDETSSVNASLAKAIDRLADQAEEANAGMRARDVQLAELKRAGQHACDLLERITERLEISGTTEGSIAAVRRELQTE